MRRVIRRMPRSLDTWAPFSHCSSLLPSAFPRVQWNGAPRGFAFVTFREGKSADAVLSSAPHRIDGRVVEIKRAVPKDESRTKLTSATKLDRRKLFVGGLPSSVAEADFRGYFERFGPIVDATVMIDRDTNRCVTGRVRRRARRPPVPAGLSALRAPATAPPHHSQLPPASPSPSHPRSSRGFGFVTFVSEDSALAVLADPGSHVLADKTVEVKSAEPKA